MNEELVDIVNERDEVLYAVAKTEAHGKGLLHRTVISELINSKGEWILVEQAPDKQDAGKYVSPMGGHVRAGESVEDALKREVFEELGIEGFQYRFVGKAIYRRQVLGRDENHFFLLYESFSDLDPTLNAESVSYQKFTVHELKEALKTAPEKFGEAFHFVISAFYPDL